MPWRESNLMDERLKFVARLLDGEKMAVVFCLRVHHECTTAEESGARACAV